MLVLAVVLLVVLAVLRGFLLSPPSLLSLGVVRFDILGAAESAYLC